MRRLASASPASECCCAGTTAGCIRLLADRIGARCPLPPQHDRFVELMCFKQLSGVFSILIALFIGVGPACARVTPNTYRQIGVTTPVDATLPADATVADEAGQRHRLASLLGHPTLLVFADYACRTLCGPAVALVVGALEQSGLRPSEQYRMIVIGLDPHATAADAARMRQEHLGEFTS